MARYCFDKNAPVVHSHGWRWDIGNFLATQGRLDGDVYQFGVAGGFSMQVIGSLIKANPTLTTRFFGFDVFTGMPVEATEPDKQRDTPGSFNLLEHYGVPSLSEAVKLLYSDIRSNIDPKHELHLFPGLVEETLTVELSKQYQFKPAFYIDMDMDIYTPTKYALNFLFQNKLVVKGTIISFDDWGQNYPTFTIYSCGESRAWAEISRNYNVSWRPIHVTDAQQQFAIVITDIGI